MARVRNNQGHRNKILNDFMRPYLEQENTQEREGYLQARETVKPLQDKTWKLAEKIVRRHYTHEDVEKAWYLQTKFDLAKVSYFHATEKTSLFLACFLVQDVLAYDLKSYYDTLDLVLIYS